ncbi:hypothetical protein AJ79_05230 [Helicocarpus griseus UAMH5409]|uniref:Uncharacterized protein n=1 Tax=Helicocarpus griseus UAMH5409 TaxID=1447875 RepID=A0A2B7XPJ9_9EURO|nr:hypothetical protein AJ79_05230 [Helicocarpus griseus UAMH5409]
MSFLAIPRSRLLYSPISCLRVFTPSVTAAGFHNSSARSVLKESDRHREGVDREGVAAEIEERKSSHHRQVQEGDPRWHESLASASEADVKADRGEITQAQNEEVEQHVQKGRGGMKKPTSQEKEDTMQS